MSELGKALLGIGLFLVLLGAFLLLAARIGLPLGRLPGDISYRGKNFSVFAPLGTSILLSLLLSGFVLPHFALPPLNQCRFVGVLGRTTKVSGFFADFAGIHRRLFKKLS